jgi:hypothetical protein
MVCSVFSKSRVLRANRSSRVTTSTSPALFAGVYVGLKVRGHLSSAKTRNLDVDPKDGEQLAALMHRSKRPLLQPPQPSASLDVAVPLQPASR